MSINILDRNLEAKANRKLENYPALLILGARQAGKTFLSKKIRSNWDYFDLENNNDFDRITADPNLFFKQNPTDIIIDEAQTYPEIFNILRGVIDSNREQNNRFIITGSSSPELLKHSINSLAGRLGIIELDPLKSNEQYSKPMSDIYDLFHSANTTAEDFLSLKPNITLNDCMQTFFLGGYPELQKKKNWIEITEWYDDYFRSYLQHDIARLFPNIDTVKFRRLINTLAFASGNIINKKNIATALGVSETTIKDYLDIAQGLFIWRKLPAYGDNSTKTLVKMPKGFLCDSGLLHSRWNINFSNIENLYSHPEIGRFFECYAIEEIIRGIKASIIPKADFSFYRTKVGAEIDLVIEGHFGTIPIEIKYSSHTPAKNLKTLSKFIDDKKLNYGIVVNQGNEPYLLTDKIVQIPINFF